VVPSAVIPNEPNYLLNPTHPEFQRIKIGSPQPFAFDPRLLR
jgi:RES domain-containing protein